MTYFDLIKSMSILEISKMLQIISYCDHGSCEGCVLAKIYPNCHDLKAIYKFLLSDI